MILDTEQQRKILLDIMMNANFSGAAIDIMYELKRAVLIATIAANSSTAGQKAPGAAQQSQRKIPDPENISRLAK